MPAVPCISASASPHLRVGQLAGDKKDAEEVLAKVKERKWLLPGWGGVGCVLGGSCGS